MNAEHDIHDPNLILNDAVENTTVRGKIQAPEISDVKQTLVNGRNPVTRYLATGSVLEQQLQASVGRSLRRCQSAA